MITVYMEHGNNYTIISHKYGSYEAHVINQETNYKAVCVGEYPGQYEPLKNMERLNSKLGLIPVDIQIEIENIING